LLGQGSPRPARNKRYHSSRVRLICSASQAASRRKTNPALGLQAVLHLQGRVAIQRGPIVYCLEGGDHGNIALDRIALDGQLILSGEFSVECVDNLLGGIWIFRGRGTLVDENGTAYSIVMNTPPQRLWI
jgi:hypothetical protein